MKTTAFPILLIGDPQHAAMQAQAVSRLKRQPVKPAPMAEDETPVIFRTFKSLGDTIAIFPTIAFDRAGNFCMSYMHTGQHGAASPMGTEFARITRPATAEEIATLTAELVRIGYKLRPVRRVSYAMHKARRGYYSDL